MSTYWCTEFKQRYTNERIHVQKCNLISDYPICVLLQLYLYCILNIVLLRILYTLYIYIFTNLWVLVFMVLQYLVCLVYHQMSNRILIIHVHVDHTCVYNTVMLYIILSFIRFFYLQINIIICIYKSLFLLLIYLIILFQLGWFCSFLAPLIGK